MKTRSTFSMNNNVVAGRVMDCGGKRSATPLSPARRLPDVMKSSPARKLRRRCALPEHSKMARPAIRAFTLLLLLSTLLHQPSTTHAQGTAFTYQGRLNEGTNAATGIYDLRFTIYDALTAGAQQGSTLTNSAVAVSNGLFTVTLDFGNQFPGADRWLELGVRTNGGGAFSTLAARRPITATPYAITAGNVSAGAGLSGTYSSAVSFNNSGNSFVGNGAGLTTLNASELITGTVSVARGGLGIDTSGAGRGSILYKNVSGTWSALSPGSAGQVLKTSGAGADPAWGTDQSGGGGTVISVNTGVGLTGGPVTSSGTVSIDTTVVPRLADANTFTAANTFMNNVGIGTSTPVSALQVVGTVTATAFNPVSDRNLKENFTPVTPREVLDKVTALPISRWNFIGDAATPHVGPMAQDFHAAFGLGTDDKHIATVDADGVALAAIQGLNEKLEVRGQKSEDRIQKLERTVEQKETEITELKARLEKLERFLQQPNHSGK